MVVALSILEFGGKKAIAFYLLRTAGRINTFSILQTKGISSIHFKVLQSDHIFLSDNLETIKSANL